MESSDVQVEPLPVEAPDEANTHLEWFLGYTGLHPLPKPPVWAFRERARYLRVRRAREQMLQEILSEREVLPPMR